MAKLNIPKYKESMVTANPLKRIAAFIIDMFLMQILVMSAFSKYFESFSPKDQTFGATYAMLASNSGLIMQAYYALITIAAIMLLYFSYMEYKYSQTVGKMIFGLRVETIDGREAGFFQCVLRNIYLIPIFPIFLLWILDPLYMFFTGDRLSEKFSKTKTVEAFKHGY